MISVLRKASDNGGDDGKNGDTQMEKGVGK